MVDVGLLHHLQELARVGRQALYVAPLPLGIDGVERQRRLARARHPREHDQRVARDLQVDILQVVLAGPADVNGAVGLAHGTSRAGGGLAGLAHVGTGLPQRGRGGNVPATLCTAALQVRVTAALVAKLVQLQRITDS